MKAYEKPLPGATIEGKAFWEYSKQHELRMQKCPVCGHIRHPAGVLCPNCHTMKEAEWVKLSGKGKVYSFVVFRYVYNRAFAEDIPYVVAVIELAEGPRMMSNIVGIDSQDIKVGMEVEVVYDDITEEYALPKFKPVGVKV